MYFDGLRGGGNGKVRQESMMGEGIVCEYVIHQWIVIDKEGSGVG